MDSKNFQIRLVKGYDHDKKSLTVEEIEFLYNHIQQEMQLEDDDLNPKVIVPPHLHAEYTRLKLMWEKNKEMKDFMKKIEGLKSAFAHSYKPFDINQPKAVKKVEPVFQPVKQNDANWIKIFVYGALATAAMIAVIVVANVVALIMTIIAMVVVVGLFVKALITRK